MPYINGRLWDADLDDFKSEGIKAVLRMKKVNPTLRTTVMVFAML